MQEYKLFAKRIGLMGITQLFNALKGILLLPILTKNMPVEDYGVWAIIIVTIGIIPNLATLGFNNVIIRFTPSIKDKNLCRDIFYSTLTIVTLITLLVTGLILSYSTFIENIFFGGNDGITEFIAIVVIIETLELIILNFFRALEQIKKYSIIIFLKNFLLVVLVAYFVFTGDGLMGAIKGLFLETFIVFVISFLLMLYQINPKVPEFRDFKTYLKYGIPTIPGMISKWIVNSSDHYVIGGYFGSTVVGYYSPGYSLGSLVQMLFQPINFMLPMTLARYYDTNNLEEVKKYLQYSTKYCLTFGIPAVFGLTFLSKPLLVILSTPEIAEKGYIITPLVALSLLTFGIFNIYANIILLVKKTHLLGTIWLLAAVLNLGLNLLLIPHFGIIAAAITTLITFTMAMILIKHYSNMYLKFNINYLFIFKSIFASVMMTIPIVLYPPSKITDTSVTIIACIAVYFVTLILLKGFDRNEAIFFKNMISRPSK